MRDGDAVRRYLAARGIDVDSGNLSDYELFATVFEQIRTESDSFAARRIKGAIDGLFGFDTSVLSVDEIWTRSALVLDGKNAESLFLCDLETLGMPVIPWINEELPKAVGKTAIVPKYCPFGISGFDLDSTVKLASDVRHGEIDPSCSSVAVFCKGFEFEEPNEYVANKAEEKLREGRTASKKERAILSAQLLRKLTLNCADREKRLMVFLPSAPDVHSMGEFNRFLEYIDGVIRTEKLSITVYAPDAVGLCFALGLASLPYKKITADTGICGNGCGCAEAEAAAYWGADLTRLKRASLSSTPAFIGK